MTTRLENKMLSVNFAFVAPMVELADTPVLGTGLSRGRSSSLLRRTKKTSLSNNTGLQICCDRCCIEDKMLQRRKGMYRRSAVSNELVSLRNYPFTSYIPTTAYSSLVSTSIF